MIHGGRCISLITMALLGLEPCCGNYPLFDDLRDEALGNELVFQGETHLDAVVVGDYCYTQMFKGSLQRQLQRVGVN